MKAVVPKFTFSQVLNCDHIDKLHDLRPNNHGHFGVVKILEMGCLHICAVHDIMKTVH